MKGMIAKYLIVFKIINVILFFVLAINSVAQVTSSIAMNRVSCTCTLVDEESNEPLSYRFLSLEHDEQVQLMTDAEGRFSIDIPSSYFVDDTVRLVLEESGVEGLWIFDLNRNDCQNKIKAIGVSHFVSSE